MISNLNDSPTAAPGGYADHGGDVRSGQSFDGESARARDLWRYAGDLLKRFRRLILAALPPAPGPVKRLSHFIAQVIPNMPTISSVGSRALLFSENAEGSAFLAQLRKQRIECRFCDIVLHVGDRCFAAHRNVLAASSAYFQSILRGHKMSREELRIHHPDPDHVQLLLDYMYSGSIVLDEGNVRAVMDLADFFIMSNLKGFCEEYLQRNLSLESCLVSKELSATYRLSHLSAAVRKFIRNNISSVLDLPIIQKMSFQRLQDLVTDPKIGCSSVPPVTLLNALVTWVKRDTPNRTACFGSLLQSVSWNEVQFASIVQHIESESLYEESKLALYALLSSLVANNVSLGPFACDYEGLSPVFKGLLTPPDSAYSTDDMDALALPFDSDPITVEVIAPKSCSSQCTNDHPPANASSSSQRKELGDKQRLSIDESVSRQEDFEDYLSDEADFSSDESGDSLSEKDETVVQWDAEEAGISPCPHCSFSATTATRLEQHMANVHEEDQTYRCKICSYECKWNRDYFKHMKEHFSGPPFRCHDCDFVGPNIRNLLSHRLMHVDDRSHFCSLCSFTTKSRTDLILHTKIHAEEKPFRCQHCGRSFGLKHTLNQHLSTHLYDRSPSCHSCGLNKKYPSSHLLSPKRGYPAAAGNMFHCPQPNCSYHSQRRSQLAAHTRSHLSIRSHVCPTCGRGFIEKSHLIRHERIHLKEKPFKCETCDYSSTRRDKLKEHIQKHHPLGTTARDSRRTRRSQNRRLCVSPPGTNGTLN